MDKLSVGMSVRRGGAKLRALSKAHTPLHVILWQARESQTALIAAAAAQKTLFNDIAAWASNENRALSDVCACASELSSMYSSALVQIAMAYKSLRKDILLILEGEKRCDLSQKKLQEADEKRLKFRRQVLRAQNKRLVEGENPNPRRSGDFTALQTQLSEAERTADRLHMEACEATREQEAVKLVVIRSALGKLSEAHLTLSNQARVIFEAEREITLELPEPPPPGDPLSSLRYTGHEATRAVVERVKSQVHLPTPASLTYSSTPVTSPSGFPPPRQSWTPTAPNPSQRGSVDIDPPPPYNTSFLSANNGREDDEDGPRGGVGGRPPGRQGSSGSGGGSANGRVHGSAGRRRSLYHNSSVSPTTATAPVATPNRYQNVPNHQALNRSRNNSAFSVRNSMVNPPQNPFYDDYEENSAGSPPPRY